MRTMAGKQLFRIFKQMAELVDILAMVVMEELAAGEEARVVWGEQEAPTEETEKMGQLPEHPMGTEELDKTHLHIYLMKIRNLFVPVPAAVAALGEKEGAQAHQEEKEEMPV